MLAVCFIQVPSCRLALTLRGACVPGLKVAYEEHPFLPLLCGTLASLSPLTPLLGMP